MKNIFIILFLVLGCLIYAEEIYVIESPIEPGVVIDFYESGKWEYHYEIIRVLDGDTIIGNYRNNEVETDICGIDAPELDQPYGIEAKEYLEKLINENDIKITNWNIRNIHILWETPLTGLMLNAGLAWADPYGDQSLFWAHQDPARQAYKGLWADRNPIPPWEWREGKRPAE